MNDSEIDLRGILSLLRRQFRLILLTVLIGTAAASVVAFALTPVFTASALILVDPSSKNLLDPDAQMTSASADNARIDSEVEIIRSENILLKVIEAESLLADDEFGVSLGLRDRLLSFLRIAAPTLPTGDAALNQTLSKLAGSISAQRRGLTYLIALQALSEDPAKAAALANATARVYIEDQLASKVSSVMTSRDILQARIVEAREAIIRSEGSFDTFISENIQRIVEESGRSDLAAMQQSIRELRDTRAQTSVTLELVQSSLSQNNWSTLVSSLQSESLSLLEQQRQALSNQLGAAAESPAAVDLRAELQRIENEMRKTATSEVSALRETVAQTQITEETMRQQMRQEVVSSALPADVLAQIYELQQSAELARNQYQTLLGRVQDLDAQANLQIADSRVVSAALTPRAASFPNRSLVIALALIASLGLGVGLAFLYENLIGGFTSEEQLESVLKLRVAAAVPRSKVQSDTRGPADLVQKSPLSMFAESVRRIRATIDQYDRILSTTRDKRAGLSIMVSSTAPNEGKTTLALSLARSYALSGRSTIIIDCDLRKPSVHRQLGIEPSLGLHEFLGGEDAELLSITSITSTDTLTDATVVVGARRSDLPTDQLLAAPSFAKLIEAARATFDVVVLDTPPIGPVIDGLYIAPFADVILFCTKWSSTSQLEARKAVASLAGARKPGAEILAVLNQQDQSARSYRQKYGSYYSEVY